MLPTVVASELREAVCEFLRSAFPIATPYFQSSDTADEDPHALIDDLLARPGSLFKGPYLDIKLPFRSAEGEALPFRHLSLPFTPYQHQLKAFRRLCGDSPQSTIVATGTGSGKTECFMLPMLDDALTRRERGIKAIVIYPMNALATDQARRFADEVSKLDTQLTVGLFVGGEQDNPHTAMGPGNIITCQKTLRQNPPDILLTNYKMLDFLLIRPKDQPLWRFNKPGMLRYLVVDELHTFDGAQGTDLACLVRRLRDRLDAGPELACVGTSATMGTDSADALIKYASEVFATEFDRHAIVAEDRLSANEYLLGTTEAEEEQAREAIRFFSWPDRYEQRLDPRLYEDAGEYLFHQARVWFEDLPIGEIPPLNASDRYRQAEAAVRLAELLHQHQAFHELVRAAESLTDLEQLAEAWQQRRNLPDREQAQRLLISLMSLVAAARQWGNPQSENPDKWCRPFLHVRLQVWLRELRRLVCSVPKGDDKPKICFSDDLTGPQESLHLPLLHCRECHMAAWGAVAKQGESRLDGDLQSFYQSWFQYSPQATLLVPLVEGQDADGLVQSFCPRCLRLQAGGPSEKSCVECEHESLLRVWVPDMRRLTRLGETERLQCHHDCPECGARDSLTIIGYRAATLTSVMTGRLFATPYNDDFKLIAFSDSVQDAAHRAGFLGANTWRQVVRQAMAGWLRKQSVALPLKEMAGMLPSYWRDRADSDAHFCGLFIAPNMQWLAGYRALVEKGQLLPGSDLPELVAKRLAWECFAEFGRRSTVGRSLERTGVAAVGFDERRLLSTIGRLASQLREEISVLRDAEEAAFTRFVVGWLHHLRQIGAVYDPVLDSYLAHKGNEFQLNRLHWMPGFGRSQRPPAAVTLQHVTTNFEALVHSSRDTWSVRWLKKTLARDDVFAAAEARQIFQLTLQALARGGWLVEREAAGEALYMLDPDRLLIDQDCQRAQCDRCRHGVSFAPESRRLYEGMPCLRPQCHGTLVPSRRQERTRDYGITAPRRLVPSEHTGLLPREVREEVERSFMERDEPWDINLLSATPTLEMGIDIGALSSVFLCSVPPAQASYLQRIGRAGRRDGNALAVTVANGQNHDLFFYSEPMEMMAGAVQTPGVFLKATAVLERQLIAYCFDRWAASGIDESAIPAQLRKVLDAVEHQHQEQFPHNLLAFIAEHRDAMLSGFFGLFEQLDDDAKAHLTRFVSDSGAGALGWRLVNRLQQLVEERVSLRKKTEQLKKERERLLREPQDEATQARISEVERERGALLSLLHGLNSQPVLNFFTDEGLLPNYAFPEEGVTLQSVILRRRSLEQRTEGDKPYEKAAYAFQRSAKAALGELAPESRFYAISHVMEIDQIDLQLTKEEQWRFCDRCHYTARVDIADPHSACPRCGSPQWKDSGQKRAVLKLRQVYSTVDDRVHRIGDDSEQREPQFFNRQMLVDIPLEGNQGGFRLKSDALPFGFEFLRRAIFREVNFGTSGGDAPTFSVAGRELSRRGFRICRHCGKVQKERWRHNEQPHAYTCKLRRNPEQETEKDYFESLYLYREVQSEAIRILLPLSEVAYSDEKLHSFIAALNLGLRRYFRGDVHHLEVTEMREPGTAESGERIYLVVYDRIPGGTGYLKELMRTPENLMKVLEYARARLTSCECIDDENRDGCYRCILAYRDSRNMPTISRKGAAELLGEILQLRDQLESVETLSEINTNVLIESKLEQKFVNALAQLPGAKMSKTLVNGKAGSLLTVPGANGRPVPWLVEHQVKVGPSDGVALQTEIDVLLRPARSEDAARYRPIAVYLDGLQYHHDIVAADVLKRSALLLSEQFWVYSLNWDDLPEPGKLIKPQAVELMGRPGPAQQDMGRLYASLAQGAGWKEASEHAAGHAYGSLEWLFRLLKAPEQAHEAFLQRTVFRGFTALAPTAVKDAALRQKLVYELGENAPLYVREALRLEEPSQIPGGFMDALGNSAGGVEMTVGLPMSAMRGNAADAVTEALRVHLCFDDRSELGDEFKAAWRAFWHTANQLQFLPGFSMTTRRAVASGESDQVWSTAQVLLAEYQPVVVEESGEDAAGWQDVIELSVLEPQVLRQLRELGLPAPEVGIDLAAEEGEVLVSGSVVELAWKAQRVAIVAEQTTDRAEWQFIQVNDNIVERLKALVERGVF